MMTDRERYLTVIHILSMENENFDVKQISEYLTISDKVWLTNRLLDEAEKTMNNMINNVLVNKQYKEIFGKTLN